MTTAKKISIALPPEMVAIVRRAVVTGNVSSVVSEGFQPTSVF